MVGREAALRVGAILASISAFVQHPLTDLLRGHAVGAWRSDSNLVADPLGLPVPRRILPRVAFELALCPEVALRVALCAWLSTAFRLGAILASLGTLLRNPRRGTLCPWPKLCALPGISVLVREIWSTINALRLACRPVVVLLEALCVNHAAAPGLPAILADLGARTIAF